MCLSLKALLLNLLVLPSFFPPDPLLCPSFSRSYQKLLETTGAFSSTRQARQTQKSQNAVVNAKMLICNSKWCHKFCLERPTQCYTMFQKVSKKSHFRSFDTLGQKSSINPKIHNFKFSFFTKLTFSKS